MSATERKGLSLQLKLFAATATIVVAVLAVALLVASYLARQNAEHALDTRLQNTGEVARRFLDAENAKIAIAAAVGVQPPPFVAAIAGAMGRHDRATILDQAQTFAQNIGADYVMITDANGVMQARSDQPGADTVSLLRSPLVGGALDQRGQILGYVNLVAAQKLFLAVATPIKDQGAGTVLGVLIAARVVSDSLAQQVKRGTGSELVFYALDEHDRPIVVASSLDRGPGLDAAIENAVKGSTAQAGSNEMRAEATLGGKRLVGFNRTLTNPGRDTPLGGYLALRSLDEELAGYHRLQNALFILAGIGILLALGASGVVARQIGKPVRELAAVANRVADGDLSAPVVAGAGGEIGQLADAFKHMVEELKAKQQLVDFLSGGAGAATQPIYTAGGDMATPTMVRSMAAQTGMLAVGQTFAGRYEIKSVLGMGGMGVVYRAVDRELNEPVAIKTLKGDAMATDPALLSRFKDEIRLARKITHRNVVRTHDLGEIEGMYYITMELCEGTSLKHLIQSRGHLPVPVVLTVGKQLCRALEVAHEQGVIHRDIKPQNLIVEPSGTLKVMDFGIARLASRTDGVTQAGMAIGSPEYMAPEQLLGDKVDFRADLYAAGCVLFECLTGRPPFTADSPISLVAKQLEESPPSPAVLNSDVPAALADLVLKTLSKKADERPASAAALHDALDAIAAQSAVTSETPVPAS